MEIRLTTAKNQPSLAEANSLISDQIAGQAALSGLQCIKQIAKSKQEVRARESKRATGEKRKVRKARAKGEGKRQPSKPFVLGSLETVCRDGPLLAPSAALLVLAG